MVEQVLHERAPSATPNARLGAVSFVHRFGSALNEHVLFHCRMVDGVFQPQQGDEEAVRFQEAMLNDADVQSVQTRVRQPVLRCFARQGYIDKDDAKDMAEWRNGGGFSVDASVRIEADDRAGLERLLCYCAHPPFALKRLEAIDAQRLMYYLPKARPDGCAEELLEIPAIFWAVRECANALTGNYHGSPDVSRSARLLYRECVSNSCRL